MATILDNVGPQQGSFPQVPTHRPDSSSHSWHSLCLDSCPPPQCQRPPHFSKPVHLVPFPRPLLFLWEKQNKKSYSLGILQTNIWNPEILSLYQNSLHFNQILCLNFLTCKILAWIQILQICCKNWKFRVGAREIAWQLRALFVLSEEQGSIPTWWLNYL